MSSRIFEAIAEMEKMLRVRDHGKVMLSQYAGSKIMKVLIGKKPQGLFWGEHPGNREIVGF